VTSRLKYLLILPLLLTSFSVFGQSYKKATRADDDVVKNKLFPKKGRTELSVPNLGVIVNQSYINSLIFHGGINYFWSEEWGIGAEGLFSFNSDKNERACIENFYNDPEYNVGAVCGPPENLEGAAGANYGPAYVPIREVSNILAINGIWNPIYGKQLFFLSTTSYLDLFLTFGLGLTSSKFYPERTILRNGNRSRGPTPAPGSGETPPGASPTQVDAEGLYSYGIDGRPEAEIQSHPTLVLGVGQKIHFMKRFNAKAEIRNYTVIGTDAGFDTFFAVWLGFGVRI
jgi:outer membrane beta-barrel protein